MTSRKIEKRGKLSVDDYVDIVREVWGELHARRRVFDYALHVLDHASKLGEAIRRDHAAHILHELAESALWLFGFVAKLNDDKEGWEGIFNINTSFSEMIWGKYPGLCPHCFKRLYIFKEGKVAGKSISKKILGKCTHCLTDYPRVETREELPEELKKSARIKLKEFADETADAIPETLLGMEDMFNQVYESNVAISSLEDIGFHLLEEAGELGRAVIDLYTEKPASGKTMEERHLELCNEVAEVFAWMCSLSAKVRADATTFDEYRRGLHLLGSDEERMAKDVGLEQILWAWYWDSGSKRFRCPYCHNPACECKVEFAWEDVASPAMV